jgi:DNA (cytosine-5)-methyltransferase 1
MRAIDLFAGSGGFSEGARQAGVDVVWAANHWQRAVTIHAMNHPDTDHECQDLCQANFSNVPDHDLLLASPACTGHSDARGKERAGHDEMRATAWAVISAADVKRPQTVIVENVPEFSLRWEAYPA